MDQQLESTVDLNDARHKRRMWQPYERPADIFRGRSEWHQARINGVNVLRLSVLPAESKSIPVSFSVIAEPDWQPVQSPALPLNFQWQQSLSGRFDFYFELASGLKCLALGERFAGLNLRGQTHTLLSTDNPQHDETMDPMYMPIPFLLVGSGEKFNAILLDTTAPSRFDLDSEMTGDGHIELFSRRGFRAFVFESAPLSAIVGAYSELVGRAKMPPLWALGHQQCRWSYPDEETVRELAAEFRQRKIPCDTIVLDIDYMDEYRVFTTSKKRFPTFDKMIADLNADNFHVVTIIDPGVKKDPGYAVYDQGTQKDLFCKTAEGGQFIEKVWPGDSAFPDFFKEETRQWWAQQHKFLLDKGIAGIWNDMNEPAFFGINKLLPDRFTELPPADEQFCVHETADGVQPHFEMRNAYGFLMCKSTHEGLLSLRPNERPFVLTRSATTGIQRYAAVWLGDNKSWYYHLSASIPMLLNVSLSGVPFCGVDIGGFWQDAKPELILRWYAAAIFYPFFRNHCALAYRGQEAFAYAPNVEAIARKLIETRYKLLPYINNLFWEHTRTGAPPMRPLIWHFAGDEIAADIDDQFMFGADIMVAPIVEPQRDYRTVYFPAGRWYHFETHAVYEGGRAHVIKMPLDYVPAFVREGAILPLADVMQHTNEYAKTPIAFHVFGKTAEGVHFEDDGASFDYERGAYNQYKLSYAGGQLKTETVHAGLSPARTYKHVVIA